MCDIICNSSFINDDVTKYALDLLNLSFIPDRDEFNHHVHDLRVHNKGCISSLREHSINHKLVLHSEGCVRNRVSPKCLADLVQLKSCCFPPVSIYCLGRICFFFP